jgi:hypothetical protein
VTLKRGKGRGVSLKKLHDIDIGAEVFPSADTRPVALQALTTISGEDMDAIEEVFRGTGVTSDEAKLRAVLTARREVGAAWRSAAGSFLEIGRALNTLDDQLRTREEKAKLKAGFERLFPFSEPVASQFRRVAEMVDSGRVAEAHLPGSYSAAYQLALLKPEELEIARREGLVTPKTSRSTLIAFRRTRSAERPEVDLNALAAEARRIRETRRRMMGELIKMRRRASEIAKLLENDPGSQ